MQKHTAEAELVRERFERAWARADVTLTSSRILNDRPARSAASAAAKPVVRSIEVPVGGASHGALRLEYVERGNPDGIPVIMLHGITDSWRSFEPVLPYLPASLRVFALTQRGHGDSGKPAGYHVSELAGDVVAFMDAKAIERAIIVGHSMGASVAQRLVVDRPERVAGLVLAGAFAHPMKNNPVIRQFWDEGLSTLADPVAPAFARAFQYGTIARPVPVAMMDTWVEESLKAPARVWKDAMASLMTSGSVAELAAINVPALLIWGEKDAFTPRSDQQVLMSAIPNAEFVAYANTGHAVHWEEPVRFADDVALFVKKLVGAHRH